MQGCLEIPFVEVCASETSLHLLSQIPLDTMDNADAHLWVEIL